jgi:hypothetical protein
MPQSITKVAAKPGLAEAVACKWTLPIVDCDWRRLSVQGLGRPDQGNTS